MLPDRHGRYGRYGGRFVPETLMPALLELEEAYRRISREREFKEELAWYLKDYVGRPTPLYFARHLTAALGGPQIYIKREDLAHTGAHKINNTLGQGLLARRMGKKRLIAETGAGQHGVATATVAALLGHGVRHLHGHRGHPAAAPQRHPHAPVGLEGDPGGIRQPDAEGRHERSHPGLGHQRAPHPLCPGLRGRAAPLPHDRPGLPVGHRQRGQGANTKNYRPPAPMPGGLRRRRQQRHGPVPSLYQGSGALRGGGGRRARPEPAASTPPPWWPGPWASCTAPSVISCKTPGATSRRPIPWPRGWTIPGSARSTPISRTRAGPNTWR